MADESFDIKVFGDKEIFGRTGTFRTSRTWISKELYETMLIAVKFMEAEAKRKHLANLLIRNGQQSSVLTVSGKDRSESFAEYIKRLRQEAEDLAPTGRLFRAIEGIAEPIKKGTTFATVSGTVGVDLVKAPHGLYQERGTGERSLDGHTAYPSFGFGRRGRGLPPFMHPGMFAKPFLEPTYELFQKPIGDLFERKVSEVLRRRLF